MGIYCGGRVEGDGSWERTSSGSVEIELLFMKSEGSMREGIDGGRGFCGISRTRLRNDEVERGDRLQYCTHSV